MLHAVICPASFQTAVKDRHFWSLNHCAKIKTWLSAWLQKPGAQNPAKKTLCEFTVCRKHSVMKPLRTSRWIRLCLWSIHTVCFEIRCPQTAQIERYRFCWVFYFIYIHSTKRDTCKTCTWTSESALTGCSGNQWSLPWYFCRSSFFTATLPERDITDHLDMRLEALLMDFYNTDTVTKKSFHECSNTASLQSFLKITTCSLSSVALWAHYFCCETLHHKQENTLKCGKECCERAPTNTSAQHIETIWSVLFLLAIKYTEICPPLNATANHLTFYRTDSQLTSWVQS